MRMPGTVRKLQFRKIGEKIGGILLGDLVAKIDQIVLPHNGTFPNQRLFWGFFWVLIYHYLAWDQGG